MATEPADTTSDAGPATDGASFSHSTDTRRKADVDSAPSSHGTATPDTPATGTVGSAIHADTSTPARTPDAGARRPRLPAASAASVTHRPWKSGAGVNTRPSSAALASANSAVNATVWYADIGENCGEPGGKDTPDSTRSFATDIAAVPPDANGPAVSFTATSAPEASESVPCHAVTVTVTSRGSAAASSRATDHPATATGVSSAVSLRAHDGACTCGTGTGLTMCTGTSSDAVSAPPAPLLPRSSTDTSSTSSPYHRGGATYTRRRNAAAAFGSAASKRTVEAPGAWPPTTSDRSPASSRSPDDAASATVPAPAVTSTTTRLAASGLAPANAAASTSASCSATGTRDACCPENVAPDGMARVGASLMGVTRMVTASMVHCALASWPSSATTPTTSKPLKSAVGV